MTTGQPAIQWRFWSIFASLRLLSLIASIDVSIVTTALPTITREIGGELQYVWIANSYPLASTVPQPLYAQISNIVGRRNPLLVAVSLFAMGSGIAGGATNPAMLIAGRVVQGLGTGGIYVLSAIVISDLVPLRQHSQYENPTDGSIKTALSRVDLLGNAILVPSILAILLGAVLGGVVYPWSSYPVIVPLVLGVLGWALFHVHQAFCKEPSIPPRLFRNRSTVSAYGMSFIAYLLTQVSSYFLPVYFMAVANASPIRAGVDCLIYSVVVPVSAVFAGGFVARTGVYRSLFWSRFALQAVGYGLLSTLDGSYSQARFFGFQALAACGTGLVIPALLPAILSPLPESDVASANGAYSFLRSFAFVWGITIASVIFNGQFKVHGGQISDETVRVKLVDGAAYTFASGGYIFQLPQSTRNQVIGVYSKALATVWQAAIAFACVGFLLGLIVKHVPLRKTLHETNEEPENISVTKQTQDV
ncbi:unnamed protein product [Penicillium crustosum]